MLVQIFIYDNTTGVSQEIEVNSTVEYVVVYHLAKQARSNVQVAAFNRAGEGVRSAAMLAGRSPLLMASLLCCPVCLNMCLC